MLWFTGNPWTDGNAALHHEEDGILVMDRGRVTARGAASAVDTGDTPVHHIPDGLIVPGFIDAHLHYPQMRVLGAWGRQLLDWLNDHTFPAELAFADDAVCKEAAELFVQSCFSCGVTSASVFPTVHPGSVEALFRAAAAQDMAVLTGKVLMDRNAPAGLMDTAQQGHDESLGLIERWHGKGRARYSVTPRFAPTSTPAQLEAAGALVRQDPTLHVQSHVSENRDEVAWVRQLFPNAEHYTDVYAQHGLLGRRTVLAHGIHLQDAEWQAIHDAGAAVAHCPSSNFFLGSGLFDLEGAVTRHKVGVALGSDIGGGTHLSPLRTMGEAYKVAQLRGVSVTAATLLWHHTAGAAQALDMADEVGNLDVGSWGDVVVLRPGTDPLSRYRLRFARDVHELLFYALSCGDDRMVAETWVAGRNVYTRKSEEVPA